MFFEIIKRAGTGAAREKNINNLDTKSRNKT